MTTEKIANPKDDRFLKASTRENSAFKWQKEDVVGAFEVFCQPYLDVHEPLEPRNGHEGREESFAKARKAWKKEKLAESFVAACEEVPVYKWCCGLLNDDKRTIQDMVPYLQKEWVPEANEVLAKHGYSVSAFLWHWSSISGSSDNYVILIRFHEL